MHSHSTKLFCSHANMDDFPSKASDSPASHSQIGERALIFLTGNGGSGELGVGIPQTGTSL
jgi:hypothetical protein